MAICVEGQKALYRFCQEHNIAHEQCGKVVVATHEGELPALAQLEERGQANGVTCSMIDVARLEGQVVDGEALMRANTLAEAESGICRWVNRERQDVSAPALPAALSQN